MERHTINYNKCIGCTACMHSCPKEAIIIKKNHEGFLYAYIDDTKCVKCGICFDVCPMQQEIVNENMSEYKKAYACYSKDINIQSTSTSGGIFYSVAKFILSKNGKVYGATMDENLKVKHILVEKEEELYKLQGSKYVQSELAESFAEIKAHLDEKEYVLFTGTGCQVSGLKHYLKKDYENLFTIDLICHGIPSPGLFEDYITYIGKKYGGKVVSYKFRQKNPKQLQSYDTKIEIYKNNKVVEKIICGDDDPYTINYLQNVLQNSECYNCKFATLNRTADITLGDYWGIDKVHPKFANANGVSLVLLNTQKALTVWENIKDELEFISTDKEKILQYNKQLTVPAPYNFRRETIYKNYTLGNFSKKFYRKYFMGKDMIIYLLKRKIRKILR